MIFSSADIAVAAKAMQESRAWPAVFQAGSAAVLARAGLEAVTKTKERSMSTKFEKIQQASLESLIAEATALAKSRKIQTEEGRAIVNLCQRILETVRHGEPKTPNNIDGAHHV